MAGMKPMRPGDKADQLARIARTIISCEQCRCEGLGKPGPGAGNPNARLVLVGEAPGKREAALGYPSQGKAGKFLRQALRDARIDENEVLFLNALKYMPLGAIPTAQAIRHGRSHLLDQLAVVDPDIVVLMGSTAVRAVFDRRISVVYEHGRVMTCAGDHVRYFFTIHPSGAVRFPTMRKLFLCDLQRLSEMVNQQSCNQDCYQQEVAWTLD